MAHASGEYLCAGTVKIDPANLAVRIAMQDVVARLANLQVKLLVRSDGDELPAVRLVLRQILINHGRLLRLVEIGLDVIDLGDLRKLGDIERTLVVRETIRAIEAFRHRLDLGLAVLLYNGGDLIAEAGPDEHGALVADAQRTRIGD